MAKVTIFTDAYLPQINGVATTIDNTAKELEKMGHNVVIVHPGMFKAKIPIQKSTNLYLPIFPWFLVYYAIREAQYVHIATEGPIGFAARLWCLKLKKNFTTSFHTKFAEYGKINYNIPEEWSWKYLRWFHNKASVVMTNTPLMEKYLHEKGITKTFIWSRGVDLERFKFIEGKNECRKLLYIGRISKEKNLESLLNLQNIFTVYMIGDGPELEIYKDTYKNVVFRGAVSQENIYDVVAEIRPDVFVFPSKSDTFGLVMLEAMAMGLPVAAYPDDATNFVVKHGYSGYLDNDLTYAIVQAAGLKREDARNWAMNFSWKSATENFLSQLSE